MGSETVHTPSAAIMRPTEVGAFVPDYVQDMMPLSTRQLNFVTHFQRLAGEHQWPSQFALERVGRAAIDAERMRTIIKGCGSPSL